MSDNRSSLSPIILFVYKRFEHTQKTLAALQLNPEAKDSDLIIYSDGAKQPHDEASINKVRGLLNLLNGFRSVTIIRRETNLGLAASIISGVTEQLAIHNRVIVLEDDLVTSPYFLSYMNQALEYYAQNDRVACIHGYCYPLKEEAPETFFIRGADCWGWGTWKRAWDLFEHDSLKLYKELKRRKLSYNFDFEGTYPYTKMLLDHHSGKVNSWAIRWLASAYLNNRLTLYPGKSLVTNIGNDNSGTHCIQSSVYTGLLSQHPIKVEAIPVEHSERMFRQFKLFFKEAKPFLLWRIWRKIFRKIKVYKE